MIKDQARSGAQNQHGLIQVSHGQDYYITNDGKLTEIFRQELQELSNEQIKLLEQKIVDLKPPEPDCFGIKRRICQVCENDCSGYQSANFMFASTTQQSGEFPTFCKQCSCPAHFHKVIAGQFNFPEDLSEIMKSNNIQSNDINWNCIMSTFMLETGSKNKIGEIIELFKNEGIEVISFTQRYIVAEEAFLLRSRIVDMQAENQNKAFNEGFKKISKDNEIKQFLSQDTFGSTNRGEQNPYLLERLSQIKEAMMQKQLNQRPQTQQLPGSHLNTQTDQRQQTASATKSVQFNENLNVSNMKQQVKSGTERQMNLQLPVIEEVDDDLERAVSNQSVKLTENNTEHKPILKNISNAGININDVFQEFYKKKLLIPSLQTREPHLKLTQQNQPKFKVADIHEEIDEQYQIEFLVHCLETNQLLRQLLQNEIVFLILSSSQVQNLTQKISEIMKQFDNTSGTRLLYYSQNKIQSLEDCVQFVPRLFRLTKSIMVSESLSSYTDGVKDRFQKDSYLGRLIGNDEEIMDQSQKLNPYRQNISNVSHYSDRNAISMQSKLTIINKMQQTIRQSGKLVKSQISRRNSVDSDNLSDASWVQRAREGKGKHKETKLEKQNNKILFNYGVMRDFLNYSGMSVQLSHKQIDFTKPIKPLGMRSGQSKFEYKAAQPCNMFAIAKVGLPNLIMPSTLDLKLTNFENFDNYVNVADKFFPELSVNHQSIIIIRPLIIRNGLINLIVHILRANEFLILKQTIRVLTHGEISTLYIKEEIPESNKELYFDIMLEGPCGVLVVSKLSGVYDAQTLFNGSSPYGRRRLNQLNEDSKSIRSNVDSVNAMFEVAPFTSFSELMDLEDFLNRNSKLSKFQKQHVGQQPHAYLIQKDNIIRKEIQLFQRFFNFIGYCSKSIQSAQQDICIFSPSVSNLEDIVLILNPMYNKSIEDVFELLIRQGFQILKHDLLSLNSMQVMTIYAGKVDFNSTEGTYFLTQMTQEMVHVFHLIKIAGDRETRQLYCMSDLQIEDLLMPTQFGKPLKPVYIPYLFLFLDTSNSYEQGLGLLYKPELLVFQGRDLFHYKNSDIGQIIQMSLLLTLGDTLKVLQMDALGQYKAVNKKSDDLFEPMNQVSFSRNNKMEPQFIMTTLNDENGRAKYCAFSAESSSQGVYELRFLTVNKATVTQNQLLQQFQTLSLYYSEASKVTSNVVPAFYKFKIGANLDRVFEIEENMGDRFIKGLAKLHIQHQKIVEMNTTFNIQQALKEKKSKSMPAFVFGTKISQLCRNLEKIKTSIKGAGKFVYSEEKEGFEGEVQKVTESSYYFYDKQRYLNYLETFKKGWLYYLSVLETDIIETKLMIILNSLTYRFSRQPQFLKLVPNRLTHEHLKISEKIKLLNQEGLKPDSDAKFFKADELGVIDPNRETEVSKRVESIMFTLKNAHSELIKKIQSKQENIMLNNTLEVEKDYSIHNDVSISGFEDGVARRPHQHLLASILWILQFELKKQYRCPQFLIGDREQRFARNYLDQEYDELIDIVVEAALQDYYIDHPEALDVQKLREDEGSAKNEIMTHIETKQKFENAAVKMLQEKVEEQQRRARATMTIQELIQTEVHNAADEARAKQRQDLKEFLKNKGTQDRDGAEFTQFLEKSKMQFGPHATKIADIFVKKLEFKMAQSKNPNIKTQEFISFLKMEYFLYGVSEAHHIIQQLRTMEEKINKMNEDSELKSTEINGVESQLRSLPFDNRNLAQRSVLNQKFTAMKAEKMVIEDQIFSFRLEISTKEACLLQVFKELMETDFYVADDFFNEKTNNFMNFKIPLSTFWRPVEIPEFIEQDLSNKRFELQVGAIQNLDSQNYAKFMSQSLRDQVLNTVKTKDKIEFLQKGAATSNLNQPDTKEKPSKLAFETYSSAAEVKLIQNLQIQEAKLKEKANKVEYKPNVLIQ